MIETERKFPGLKSLSADYADYADFLVRRVISSTRKSV
jgi:hypothetical protein